MHTEYYILDKFYYNPRHLNSPRHAHATMQIFFIRNNNTQDLFIGFLKEVRKTKTF